MSEPAPSRNTTSRRREVIFWTVLGAVLFTTRASFADQYVVPSESMSPTVLVGDRVVVSKIHYGLRVPLTNFYLTHGAPIERGDVVVLDSPEQDMVLLKRVVAVEGDRVEVHGGSLRLNGRDVPIAHQSTNAALIECLDAHCHPVALDDGGGPDFDRVVPVGHVLVMGDNRGNSRDGRTFGFVARERVLGRARGVFFRNGSLGWWPLAQ